jgi:hypothetical protein
LRQGRRVGRVHYSFIFPSVALVRDATLARRELAPAEVESPDLRLQAGRKVASQPAQVGPGADTHLEDAHGTAVGPGPQGREVGAAEVPVAKRVVRAPLEQVPVVPSELRFAYQPVRSLNQPFTAWRHEPRPGPGNSGHGPSCQERSGPWRPRPPPGSGPGPPPRGRIRRSGRPWRTRPGGPPVPGPPAGPGPLLHVILPGPLPQ